MAWTFPHDWSAPYEVTYRYKTEVLTTYAGLEQRRALRGEPRRTLATRVTRDIGQSRVFDRFLWNQQSTLFAFPEPRGTATPMVRLPDNVTVQHLTSGVSTLDVRLDVDPGTETFAEPVVDASYSYGNRLVFPLRINWSNGIGDALGFPRDTLDFDYGRTRQITPIAFGTRVTQVQTIVEDNSLSDFFRRQRGRQGDFLTVSALDDLEIVSLTGTTLTAAGDARPMDGVDWGVRIELRTGGRYFRQVLGYGTVADGTALTIDQGVPDVVNASTVRRCAWVRLARFASDDLTVQWVTATTGQAQVAVQTLPPAPVEDSLGIDNPYLVDYYGWPDWLDRLDYIVNVQMPRIG